jgi:pyruvate dehydrogenase phosphatase
MLSLASRIAAPQPPRTTAMRRVAARAFRTTCQFTARGLGRSKTRGGAGHALPLSGIRYQSTASSRTRLRPRPASAATASAAQARLSDATTSAPLHAAMYTRRLSLAAVISGLVGYGAWQMYRGNETDSTAMLKSYSTGQNVGPTRQVLVIGADELHTGTFTGEGPISKTTGEGRKVLEMLTPEQATERLRKSEESYLVNRGQGVVRYDLVQLPSNDPIEDDHAEKIIEIPTKNNSNDNNDWMFWGVFDGHSGWTTSAKLRQTLISYVARELNDTYHAANGVAPASSAIDEAIKTGFTRLDDEICNQSVQKVLQANNKTFAAELLAPALSGSCALLSFYDSKARTLRVACTGDSRAVLGRRSSSGKWTATPLSSDQTGSNPDEEARMRKQHPGEQYVIRNGRVLGGLEPTRAFGDASYKWTLEVSKRLRSSFFGRTPSPLLKTPPYVTAEPVVTATKIEPEKGDFVVMATDGLWEMLTNEEVVGLVGKWIETQAGSGHKGFASLWSSKDALPVEHSTAAHEGDDGQKIPIRLEQWGLSADDKNRFVVKDKNAATHLIRNALGGRNEEQVSALLTLPSPFSRRYR